MFSGLRPHHSRQLCRVERLNCESHRADCVVADGQERADAIAAGGRRHCRRLEDRGVDATETKQGYTMQPHCQVADDMAISTAGTTSCSELARARAMALVVPSGCHSLNIDLASGLSSSKVV